MPHSHNCTAESVSARKNTVQQIRLIVLEVSSQRIRAEICHLDHASQRAIHEQRSLDQIRKIYPLRTCRMETLHEIRVFFGYRWIVVVNK